MKIVGIGIDTICIKRMKEAIFRRGHIPWIQKILTNEEQKDLSLILKIPTESIHQRNIFAGDITDSQFKSIFSYLSARFCIKEAIYKAMYPIKILRWKDVSIIKGIYSSNDALKESSIVESCKKPVAFFSDPRLQSNYTVDISMTHEEDHKIISIALITTK